VRYHALACDYDGTLASGGRVAPETVSALRRLRSSGRRLLMVTGRQMGDLLEVCPEVGLFDRVVAENGAVVYAPASGRWRALAEPPPTAFITALRRRGVDPLAMGQVVVATERPHDTEAEQVSSLFAGTVDVYLTQEEIQSGKASIREPFGPFGTDVVSQGIDTGPVLLVVWVPTTLTPTDSV